MRALCALDVFTEPAPGRILPQRDGQAAAHRCCSSYRAAVLFLAGDVRWRCWSDLLGTVRAGGGGAERALGVSLFDFYATNPEQSDIHDQAMRGISAAQVAAVLQAMDFSEAGLVIDVGGGTGELLAAILRPTRIAGHSIRFAACRRPRRFRAERPAASVIAMQHVGGSFFDAVPLKRRHLPYENRHSRLGRCPRDHAIFAIAEMPWRLRQQAAAHRARSARSRGSLGARLKRSFSTWRCW